MSVVGLEMRNDLMDSSRSSGAEDKSVGISVVDDDPEI